MQAYCGLICSECGAYIAKQTDDDELRQKTAEAWTSPDYPVSEEEINCDGCKSEDSVLFKHCDMCEVRACAMERGVETCAHCDDYPCLKLQALWDILGDTPKENLYRISQSL